MLRIRAKNRTSLVYVRYARFPQMQALASLFACGQPLKTTHCVVFLTLSFKSLLLSIVKQNGQAISLVRFVWRRNRDLFNSGAGEFSHQSEALAWRAGVHAVGGTMHRIVRNPISEH